MATARRLPSGSWRVQVYAGRDAAGKRIYRSITAPTKKEAEYVAAEYIFKAKTKSHVTPNFTVGEAFDDYDIKNGIVTLNRSVVDIDGKPVIKEDMKEEARTRKHRLPEYIMQLIGAVDGDYIVPLSGQAIYKRWSRLLEKHELPHITFHDLRHVNASVMLLLNIPDKYAMERGGWKTDKTMKKVYQNTFLAERIAVDSKVNNYFESIIQHEMQHKK